MVGALSTMSGCGGSVFRAAKNGRCGDTEQPWMAATGTLCSQTWLLREQGGCFVMQLLYIMCDV